MLLAVFLGLASTLLSGLVLATPLDSAASQERSLDDALDFTLLARGSTSYSAVFRLRVARREQTMTVIKRGSDDWSFDLTPIPDLAVHIPFPLVKIAKSSISMNCGGKAVRSPELCQGVQGEYGHARRGILLMRGSVEYCKSPTAEMELETSSSSG
ncbi:uncharacterized protein L969DRAFT_94210 [Mixia osmundae IAM 14324]|uniref:Uncharacterized protein n=1 Tax=Mixia osmundae (strain CBS 9802 / IAM 14324 / JCM 22182 / KY 12970) TaxID=764103 RepID=G7E6G8_MIXOS|nr:uncharacterized protein L969DRAFT_94210 [Mixia osmundae IAM 14324]KEI40415.1 hypothetical protein L969DRAFT_94210 [Mixia osmundae IAM 14324]GAA98428.1 hypothetical protein E5Q_05114 [Mixia osmundae IAM 14324]